MGTSHEGTNSPTQPAGTIGASHEGGQPDQGGLSAQAVSRTQKLTGKDQEQLQGIAKDALENTKAKHEPASPEQEKALGQEAIREMVKSAPARTKDVTDGKGDIQNTMEQQVAKEIENDSKSPAKSLANEQKMAFATPEKDGILNSLPETGKKEAKDARDKLQDAGTSSFKDVNETSPSLTSTPGRQRAGGQEQGKS